MKKWIIAISVASMIGISYGELVAHYTLDETSGTNVVDSSSNAIVGTIIAGDISVDGIANSGFHMGSPGGITTPDNSFGISNDAPRTVSFWFNATSVVKRGRLIGMGSAVLAEPQSFDITLENIPLTGDKNAIGLRYGNGNYFWSGGSGISVDEWHHIVLSYAGGEINADDADRTIKLYIDGIMVDRDGGNNNNTNQLLQTTDRFAIGQQTDSGFSADATVDDVQVYNTAISQEDVTFLFNNPGREIGYTPPPQEDIVITEVRHTGTAIEVDASGLDPAYSYRLVRTIDLTNGGFTNVVDGPFAGAEIHTFTDNNPQSNTAFYRVEIISENK